MSRVWYLSGGLKVRWVVSVGLEPPKTVAAGVSLSPKWNAVGRQAL